MSLSPPPLRATDAERAMILGLRLRYGSDNFHLAVASVEVHASCRCQGGRDHEPSCARLRLITLLLTAYGVSYPSGVE